MAVIAVRTLLSCRHEMLFAPEPYAGDLVLCTRCREYRTVVGFDRISTRCRRCSYSRTYAASEHERGAVAAREHIAKNAGHEVVIRYRNQLTVIRS